MNVALFGFMGVGKSTVGRILAERLGLEFSDLDEEVVRRTGKPISAIFEEGEASFRKLEKAIAIELAGKDGQVIACGGGTVLDPDNLESLRRSSVMVLLSADPEKIVERVGNDGSRPLLNAPDKLDRVRGLLEARQSLYLKAADIIVDTSDRTVEQVAEDTLHHLEGMGRQLDRRGSKERS